MKKVLTIVKNIFVWLIVAMAVCMMIFTIISVTTFDRNDRSLFGFKAFIVRSDSMSATDFNAGDLILVKNVDPSTLAPGDIISYQSTNTDNYGETVTHKIRSLTITENGDPGFITYGTTTNTDDENPVTYSFILGKYTSRIPKVGVFLQFLKTTPGYIVCIFLPFLFLILMQGFNSIKLFKQYKKEQMEEMEAERLKQQQEIQAERESIQNERLETMKLMEELKKLKSELTEAKGQSTASSEKASDSESVETIGTTADNAADGEDNGIDNSSEI